jgi:glycerol-3-phosphate dehydrogenase (NAD(P)+)
MTALAPRARHRAERAVVFGAGTWGTAFAAVLCDAGTPTTLWARREELAGAINDKHENLDYLPGVRLPDGLLATHDPAEAASDATFVVLAVPSQTLRVNLAAWTGLLPADALLVSLMKGIELGTTKRMSEVIAEVADVPAQRVAVLSGPNLAKEIAEKQPAAAVVACDDEDAAAAFQTSCTTPYFRPYTNTDVVGTEIGGAAKNVIAIAVGMAEGMGLGDNSKASLITRGLAETARLGTALGANPMTFAGLAGLGDLVATCGSPLSRNHSVGVQLGQGRPLHDIQQPMRMVAEGVKSSESILELATKHDVPVPIIEHVVKVVRGELTPSQVLRALMSRDLKSERLDA